MTLIMDNLIYKAFGLTIQSEFDLPELPNAPDGKSGYRYSDRNVLI